MTDEERSGSCIIQPCPRDPLPGFEPVCGPHRSRLSGQLRDIPVLVEELRGESLADLTEGQERIEEKADHLVDLDGELAAVVRIEHFHLLEVNAGAVPGQSSAPRVRGSREAPIPINVDRLDLLGPADPRTVHDLSGDQIGYPSAATVLDGWCAMFAEEQRHSIPKPEVATQSKWLLDRLDELFKHPAIDECAKEIGDLWHRLRRACGLTDPKPELVEGVPCKTLTCDLKTIYRMPVSVYEQAEFAECASCSRLYTLDDLDTWIRLVRAPLCGKRNGEWYCVLQKKHEWLCLPLGVLKQLIEEGPTVTETIEQRRERVYRETMALEAVASERFLWWLSFTDPEITATIPKDERRPGGKSFLGVCIVEAATALGATIAAHAHGCNPGGQVATFGPLPSGSIPDEWLNRLLAAEEADQVPEPTT